MNIYNIKEKNKFIYVGFNIHFSAIGHYIFYIQHPSLIIFNKSKNHFDYYIG